MSDRRTTPMNDRVVAADWPDPPAHLARVQGARQQISTPVADLCAAPNGPRDRQLLLGEAVDVFEQRDGWSFLRADKDGYVGYLRRETLEPVLEPTHWVCAPATHLYPEPDFKQRETALLSFGARLTVTGESGRFLETSKGYVPRAHMRMLGDWMTDPVAAAELLLGTPYLWGGNSRSGVDCSGLVQAGMLACGMACDGDSDQQQANLGHHVTSGRPFAAGDILFWKGHVGFVAGETLLHANAFHMSTVHEPLDAAIRRIRDQGDGEITAHKRL